MSMSQKRIQNRDTAQHSSDMVERVARAINAVSCLAPVTEVARAALEASHYAEMRRALQRCRRFLTSNWSANEAEACLNDLETLITKIGGDA